MNYSEKIAEELKEKYRYRIELHAHTSPASPCSDVKPRDVVKTFFDAGYDGIAITNHFFPKLFDFKSADEYVEFYKKDFDEASDEGEKLGMKVYLGAELRFPKENNNDYLLYGWNFSQLAEIYKYLNGELETFINDCKTEDMFIVQAHPFRDNMVRVNTNLLDAVEAFNMHPHHNGRIAMAAKFAEEKSKIMTVGTDYHHVGHHGLCATRTSVLPNDTHELIDVLKSDDFVIEIGGRIVV